MAFLKAFFQWFSGKRLSPNPLESRLGYCFKNSALLEQALSHRSFAFTVGNGSASNERLEFLGDSVLGFVISEYLYGCYPHKQEGELSRIKSLIISRKALKEAADRIGLSQHLLLSQSEEKTGGRERFSINSNTFEAVIAAIYLDGGLAPAKAFIYADVIPLLDGFLKDEEFVNYKSRLLEKVQAKTDEVPRYTVISESGPDHNKTFQISASFWGKPYGTGEGKSKKEAEQAAARAALAAVEQEEFSNASTSGGGADTLHSSEKSDSTVS